MCCLFVLYGAGFQKEHTQFHKGALELTLPQNVSVLLHEKETHVSILEGPAPFVVLSQKQACVMCSLSRVCVLEPRECSVAFFR